MMIKMPQGWKLWRDEDGFVRLDDPHDNHLELGRGLLSRLPKIHTTILERFLGELAASNVKPAVEERRHCRPCNAQRKGSVCWKCGVSTDPVPADWEYPALPDVDPIRKLAHEVGYALAVHGSLERDLDLIAAPWAEDAVSAEELVLHIVRGLNAIVVGPIEQKPLGRIAASIKIQGWFKMIDLSVCPPQASATVPDKKAIFGWLKKTYTQSADGRQMAMGLQYMTAETHVLAGDIADMLAASQPETKKGGV